MSRNLLKTALAAGALTACFGAQAAANGVSVTLVPEKTALGKADDVVVTVTFTNTSGSPQYVLKSQTPFGEITAPLFDITRDGSPVRYLGMVAKRPAPTAADYYLLKPGASYSAKVELSALYDMATTGDYRIRFHAASPQLLADVASGRVSALAAGSGGAAGASAELESDSASVFINGSRPRGSLDTMQSLNDMMSTAASGPSLSFNQCSSSQQSDITKARAAALTMATNGDAYMTKGTMGTRYTHWFGSVNSSRVSTIKSHYAAIKDVMANKAMTVDCSCTDSSYAYVYPNQPYIIHICKAFWSAPMTGTDSKGGTLIHETSHFDVVAGTNDWVYGQSAAASLAISNPSEAIDNADSHEYFGENTPALQ